MVYKQLATPNLDPYVYNNGKLLTSWAGWCLATVQTAFNSSRTSPTAWSEWLNVVKYKHQDRNLPSGVYVPIWFSGAGGDGHVAFYKDGTVWTSPRTAKPYFDTYNSIDAVAKAYGVTYVGWSEDIGNKRVVEPVVNTPQPTKGDEAMAITSDAYIKNFYHYAMGREATAAEVAFHKANSTPESMLNGAIANKDLALFRLGAQVSDLQTQVNNLNQSVTELRDMVTGKQKELAAADDASAQLKQTNDELTSKLDNTTKAVDVLQKDNARLEATLAAKGDDRTVTPKQAIQVLIASIKGLFSK